ncbi:MAG: Fe-Mn family superoxide dismutase [bacterium]|nr:Fe-Mn family superoxide dismutase [bacterium]
MKDYSVIKNLPFGELRGISQKTIEIHWGKLYQGYVKKWQEIQEKLKAGVSRDLKVEESFCANAIVLHEAYFDILGGEGKLEGEIIERIKQDFGSFENWLEEFKTLGLSARGWMILAFDFNDGRLKNYIADSHNSYGIWGASPVLVLDVYEHAYFIDFGADKKAYIQAFFQNLNWQAINKKWKAISTTNSGRSTLLKSTTQN